MRAQTIYETIGFKRGRDSKHALDIGLFDENGQKKTEEEIQNENLLSHVVNWTSKESEARYIKDTIITSNIENLLEIANIFTIPYEELFIPDNNILSVVLPPKYTHNIFMIWGEEEENLYLIDCQGYDYVRYITHLVPQSGINENINFKRGIDSKESLGVGSFRFNNVIDSNDLESFSELAWKFSKDASIEELNIYAHENWDEYDENSERWQKILYLWNLFIEGKIVPDEFFDYKEMDKMEEFINNNIKGRYAYNGYPGGDGWLLIFSTVQFPQAESLTE